LGTRLPGKQHPAEAIWQKTCAVLSAWCAGRPVSSIDLTIDSVPASRILSGLGERSELKEWQVQRVVEKIRSLIQFPWSQGDPAAQYVWLLFAEGTDGSIYRTNCPERYLEHEDYWYKTARTFIHDTENGDEVELSLALAIDMLWPCHWRFMENLRIVLEAIGGHLYPKTPFAACGRNINLLPVRDRMNSISNTLMSFCDSRTVTQVPDRELLTLLGKPTREKIWLAASLDKTIRLQLDPPPEFRKITALAGPDWIRK
jgi:hypothetical protein